MSAPRTARWWGARLLDGDADTTWAITDGPITRGALRERVAGTAGTLRCHGIRPGDSVLLSGRPSLTFLWTVLALWSMDVQAILIDARISPREARGLIKGWSVTHHVQIGSGVTPEPFVDECEIMVEPWPWPWPRPPRDDDRCLAMLTSGATGRPKLVARSGSSLLAEVQRFGLVDGMPRRGERVLLLQSMTHAMGLVGGVLHALHVGATLVLPRDTLAGTVLACAGAHRVDVLLGTPTHFRRLADGGSGRAGRPGSLRLAVSSGEPLGPGVGERFADAFGVRIGQAYGLSEVGIVATDLAADRPAPAVGTPVPGLELRIVDGELQVACPGRPYLGEGDGWSDGWLSTGDLVHWDEDDVLWLHGRVSSPEDDELATLERVLTEHDRIREALVLRDPVTRTRVEAHVATEHALSPAELAAWCRRRAPSAPVPRSWHVVAALPTTYNGKVLRQPARLQEAYSTAGRRPGAARIAPTRR